LDGPSHLSNLARTSLLDSQRQRLRRQDSSSIRESAPVTRPYLHRELPVAPEERHVDRPPLRSGQTRPPSSRPCLRSANGITPSMVCIVYASAIAIAPCTSLSLKVHNHIYFSCDYHRFHSLTSSLTFFYNSY